MRRYAMLQRARDADVFGILVGTLGVGTFLAVVTEIAP
jgi:diphthamide biosynthesis protein 2